MILRTLGMSALLVALSIGSVVALRAADEKPKGKAKETQKAAPKAAPKEAP